MRRRMSRLLAIWPALLVAAAAFQGGLLSSTREPQASIGQLVILLLALPGALELRNPWRLGNKARWLLVVSIAGVAASWWWSEVPRAGRVGLTLLPALLLTPAAVARTLSTADARRRAVAAWGLAVTLVALFALIQAVRFGGPAAAPLGHHNLLGVWLAIALPVAAVGWRHGGAHRAISALAVVSGAAALADSRSLTAAVALAVAAGVAARRRRRGQVEVLLGVVLLVAGLALPRLARIARGDDLSVAARQAYAAGAALGVLERPWIGWGPGSLPWTFARVVDPVPGVNPSGELIGDPHSLPLQLAYELGLPVVLLVAVVILAFVARRWRRLPLAVDPSLALAGQASVAAAIAASLAGAWLAIPALPLTALLGAGFALGGEGRSARPSKRGRVATMVAGIYVVFAIVVLAAPSRAHFAYQRAAGSTDAGEQAAQITLAARLDPTFPLYAARRSWLVAPPKRASWLSAIDAAKSAQGVAPLWLRAGALSLKSKQRSATVEALRRAMFVDPLSAAAPFLLFEASGGREIDCGARALLADPHLAAAILFRGREPLRRAVLDRARRWRGVDAGWRRQLVRQALHAAPGGGAETDLVVRMDRVPALSASVYLFRRSPWPAELARIRLDGSAARRIRLPPASGLASSSREAFPRFTCGPEMRPAEPRQAGR